MGYGVCVNEWKGNGVNPLRYVWCVCVLLNRVVVAQLIEGWKITKTNDVTLDSKFPFVHLADKSSYSSKTREFDEGRAVLLV